MQRNRSGGRISLLATTSFFAVNILAGAGALTATAFAPSVALAACTPDGAVNNFPPASVDTCTGTDPAISYTNATHKFDVILDGETVTTAGIVITSASGQDLGITNVLNASSVNGAVVGVFVNTGGNINIDFSDAKATTKIVGGFDGIDSISQSGTNTVRLGAGSTTTGTALWGVFASNTGVGGVVTVVNDGSVLNGGVFEEGNGPVNYSGAGAINNNHGVGLRLETVTNGAAAAITATVDGIVNASTGDGILIGFNGLFASTGPVILTTNKSVSSLAADGIDINSGGAVTVSANDFVFGVTSGITVVNTGAAATVITVGTGGTVVATAGPGIRAVNSNTGAGLLSEQVSLVGNAAVSTFGNGIIASLAGGSAASFAKIDLNSGKVDAFGSGLTGVAASVDDGGSGGTGSATVTSGAGATVKVGLIGGSNNTGISVFGSNSDSLNTKTMSITLAGNNVIQVGDVAGANNIGLSATADPSLLNTEAVAVTAGINLDLKVNGDASTGILASSAGGFSGTVTAVALGGGAIVITDNGGGFGNSVGIKATNNVNTVGSTSGLSVLTGTTTISVTDGIGIFTSNSDGTSTVTTGGR